MEQNCVTIPLETLELVTDALKNAGIPGCMAQADDALDAIREIIEQQRNISFDEWKLVSVEPTQDMIDAVPELPHITDQEIEQLWYPSASIAEPGKRRVAFGRAVLDRAFGKLQKCSKV